MPTSHSPRHTDPSPCVNDPDANVTEVVSLLRKAVAALDQMWHEALLSGSPHAAMGLGEASHGVHRALIALDEAGVRPTREIRRPAPDGRRPGGIGPAVGAGLRPPTAEVATRARDQPPALVASRPRLRD